MCDRGEDGVVFCGEEGGHEGNCYSPLHAAVIQRDYKTIREILSNGNPTELLEQTDREGRNPVFLAALMGDKATLDLLRHGAGGVGRDGVEKALATYDNEGISPLTWACLMGHKNMAEELISTYNLPVNSADLHARTPLLAACRANHTDIIHLLLGHGANPNIGGKNGELPAMWSAYNDNFEAVQMLLNSGSLVNVPDKQSRTLILLVAASPKTESVEVMRRLLNNGADVNSRFKGATILHALALQASAGGPGSSHESRGVAYEKMLMVLKATKGTSLFTARNLAGDTALHIACRQGLHEQVQLMMEHDPNISVQDTNSAGDNPVHLAARNDHGEVLRVIRKLADPDDLRGAFDSCNNNGSAPLMCAAQRGSYGAAKEIVEAMEELGMDLDSMDKDGRNSLHWAAASGKAACFGYIYSKLSHKRLVKDAKGKTPASLARDNLRQLLVELLANAYNRSVFVRIRLSGDIRTHLLTAQSIKDLEEQVTLALEECLGIPKEAVRRLKTKPRQVVIYMALDAFNITSLRTIQEAVNEQLVIGDPVHGERLRVKAVRLESFKDIIHLRREQGDTWRDSEEFSSLVQY